MTSTGTARALFSAAKQRRFDILSRPGLTFEEPTHEGALGARTLGAAELSAERE